MKKILFTFCMVFLGSSLFAQQDALYSQYMFNGLVLNPAYAGNKGVLNINLVNRNQWVGQKVEGAPQTQALTADGSFMDGKVGLGVHLINDKVGAQSQQIAMFSYAYKIPVSETADLSFGLGGGVANFVLDGTQLTTTQQGDQAIPTERISHFTPDVNFGVYLSHEKYYVGLSTTHLITLKPKADFANYVNLKRHYYLTGGYIFPINDFVKAYPSVLVKSDLNGPINVDVNGFVMILDKFSVGASYRTGVYVQSGNYSPGALKSNSVVAMAQIYMLDQKLRVGYSYDFDVSKTGYSRNTHEISLGYLIKTEDGLRNLSSPRYY